MKNKTVYKTDGDGNLYEVYENIPEIDYEERAYQKEQMKFRKRFSNKW